MNGKEDLAYFVQLHNRKAPHTPDHSAAMWDQRAEAWEKDGNHCDGRKENDRVQSAVDYLRDRGVLGPDCDVIDLGCGPGRFAAAFARTAHHVTGIDISERMIHYGTAYIQRAGLQNVSLRVCDFQEMDVDGEGLANQFDLVFSSLTPAIHGMAGLEKSMRLSRKYCCNITHIRSENELESRIMREVFDRDRPAFRTGSWFYSTFNVLLLMGYLPETTYFKRHQERGVTPDRAQLFVEQMLQPEERTPENEQRVREWLQAHANADGLVTEISDVWYGRLLWDVREKIEKPTIWPVK